MKLCTSTGIVCETPDGGNYPMLKTLRYCYDAGFTNLDLNFYDWNKPNSPLWSDNWEAWVDEVAEEAYRLGLSFPQAHACFYPFLSTTLTAEERAWHEEIVTRSIIGASKIGAKVIVTHPDTDQVQRENSKQGNLVYMRELNARVEKYGMKLAIENMWDKYGGVTKYCGQTDELIDLVDSLDHPNIGICWDFEHAGIMNLEQAPIVRKLGKRLIATHVSDSHSDTDYAMMHILPLLGPIKWEPIMQALREIDYKGMFSFEVSHHTNYLPESLIPSALNFAYDVGRYLVDVCGLEEQNYA